MIRAVARAFWPAAPGFLPASGRPIGKCLLGSETDPRSSSRVRLRFLPVSYELQSVFALVQAREAGYLPAYFFQPLLQLRIGDRSVLGKYFPGYGNRGLLRNHPRVQRPADVAQAVHRIEGAHAAAGH